MTAFLAWVYAQASKVYDWFGSSYQTLRTAAANAWNWAVDRANAAFNAAVNYAYEIMQSVKGGITSSINWILQQIENVRNGLIEDITGLFDWVEYKLSSVRDLIVEAVQNFIGDVGAWIDDARNLSISLFNDVVAWVQEWVWSAFGWIAEIKDRLFEVLSIFDPDNFRALLVTIEKIKSALLTFLDNPVEFILDMIWYDFINFLSFVLAHAMGTTKSELPNTPPWKR
jgi:hypothetical protein